MSSLLYKTAGMSGPQGKPRVYFCCHPDDFDAFFEPISNEILALQNCAIWYPSDRAAARDSQFLADLAQMQLFVMPVTSNLLYTENPALDAEFPLALQHHIPVLPLMQEEGLAELFNQKCGDLQYLDRHSTDSTALRYEEKLKKYLSAVLIGDQLAEQIRNAFDAYVFLSYRKKDRGHARELMRLIHKNPFCRDIAIWYDEFLTPGENFNDAIRDALLKSGLFVLAVTPNLINEPNYIMSTEYPLARQEGKPILPAELVPTDRQQLAEKYTDLPACTDAHNETALSQALLDALKQVAITENDDSPQHNFFIGLAYLGGIDVEVDHQRALELITTAAEAGLPEAMEQLIRMYRYGIAVPCDYTCMAQWQQALADTLKARLHPASSAKEIEAYESIVHSLARTLKQMGRARKAVAVYQELLAVLQGYADADPSAATHQLRFAGACYHLFSSLYDEDAAATGWLLQAADRFLSTRWNRTEENISRFSMICRSLLRSCSGTVRQQYADRITARLEEIVAFVDGQLAAADDLARNPGLARSYLDAAAVYEALPDAARAGALCEAHYRVCAAEAQRNETADTLETLIMALNRLYRFHDSLKDSAACARLTRDIIAVRLRMARLLQDSSMPQAQMLEELSLLYSSIARNHAALDDTAGAVCYHRKSCDSMEAAAALQPSAEGYALLGSRYAAFARYCEGLPSAARADQAAEHKTLLQKSAACAEQALALQQAEPAAAGNRRRKLFDLSQLHHSAAGAYARLGDDAAAIKHLEQRLELELQIFAMTHEPFTAYQAFYDLARACHDSGRYAQALDAYRQGLPYQAQEAAGDPSAQNIRRLAHRYETIGELEFLLGNCDAGLQAYETALAQLSALYETQPERRTASALGGAMDQLLRLLKKHRRDSQAIAPLQDRLQQLKQQWPAL